MGETADGFRERARFEAARYGSDPWVFVRELLQNARDAGAGEVRFRATASGGRERLSCRDDGDGMTADHAKRFLFKLYASSKHGDATAAGRFGIGFWSVLRFEPDLIIVRSRPRGGEGWEIRLDGALERAAEGPVVMQPGTEVVLERRTTDGDTAARIAGAVRADAALLRRRDDPTTPVEIFVNDERVQCESDPPTPHLRFEARGLRGLVALGDQPRVDLLASGLRVRTAASLDELLLAEAASPAAPHEPPEGLLPQIVLDSDRLRVLMARGEARDDAELRRVVRIAGSELDRLIRAELDLAAPVGPLARLGERLAGAVRRHPRLALGAAVTALVATVAVLVAVAPPWSSAPPAPARPSVRPAGARAEPPVVPLRGLAERYDGPSVGPLAGGTRLDLRYRPVTASPLLGVLRLHGMAADGSPAVRAAAPAPPAVAPSPPCRDGCLEIEVAVASGGGLLRLPVATGHEVEARSLRLDGRGLELLRTADGEPAVWLEGPASGRLSYRSGPAPVPVEEPFVRWPELPAAVADALPSLELLPPAERVAVAEAIVGALVHYDRSAATGRLLEEGRRVGTPLLEVAIDLGRGDCDVQNSLLAALLTASGVPAVLVVGYAGDRGRVMPGLHAWVEAVVDGRWIVVDASRLAAEDAAAGPPVESPPVEPGGAAALQPTASARAAPVGPSRARRRALVGAAASAAIAAGLGAVMAWLVRRRRASTWSVEADGGADLARLLAGALLRPEVYRRAPALSGRPLVPLIGGRRVSLHRVGVAAHRDRLFRSDGGSPLARRAAGRGDLVVDASEPAGRVVADLLGARDLDGWSGVAERAATGAAVERGEAALRRLGPRWRLVVADAPPAEVAVVDGRMLGLERGSRVVVVDRGCDLWKAVAAGADRRPSRATLVLADGLADALDLEPRRRREWLARLAREALEESGGAA